MYLSKIEMEISDPGVRAALQDAQKMHRLVTGTVGTSRKESELLYRCRTQGTKVQLYLYSSVPVDPKRLLPCMEFVGQRDLTDWLNGMEEGQVLGFDLLTMPFHKVSDDNGRNSRRRVLRTLEERLTWLSGKAEQNGFSIVEAQESSEKKMMAAHEENKGGELYLDAYRYTGRLLITDIDAFRNAVRSGIGPGKAYGLGMLLLMVV